VRCDTRVLTARDFLPYGDVVAAARGDVVGVPANMGTAARFNRLVNLKNLRPETATPNLAVFRVAPFEGSVLEVSLLEKHPRSTQVFMPMGAQRYLVVVARGEDEPDLSTLSAFIAGPNQGIAYAPGVWHYPIVALDRSTDFACLVYEDGSDDDCVVHSYESPCRVYLNHRSSQDGSSTSKVDLAGGFCIGQ